MSGLYACGVLGAIHTMLAKKGVACPHCETPDWKDFPNDAFADYTNYGSFGEPPHAEVF